MEVFLCPSCIAAMPAVKFWFVFTVIAGLSLASLLGARASFVKARLIEDMPTSRIRSASQGFVELVGLATGRGNTLKAPLTGRHCLWWRYTIERYQKSGKSSSWRTVAKGVSSDAFYMDDGSGVCRIDPAGADISCLHRKVWYGHSRLPDTAILDVKPTLFNRIGGLMIGGGRYRYREFLIRESDPLYLLGHFVSDSSGRRIMTVDQVAGNLIRQWKKDYSAFLVRFDENGDGEIDDNEWSMVQARARSAVVAEATETASLDTEHLVTKPENSGLPYLIGSHGQEALSRKYRFTAIAFAAAFLLFGVASVWLLQGRFY